MTAARRLFRPGLTARLGLAMLLAVIAVIALAVLHALLVPPPRLPLLGGRWLAAAAGTALEAIAALPAAQRNDRLAALPESEWLALDWQPAPPQALPAREGGVFAREMEARLQPLLGGAVRAVAVDLPAPPGPPGIRAAPGDPERPPPEGTGPPTGPPTGAGEWPMPGQFRVGLLLDDGSWLSLQPRLPLADRLLHWPWLPLLGGALAIAGLAAWTAGRVTAPLRQLVAAAERLGVTREAVPVPDMGLAEFAPIARAFNEMQVRLKRFVDERTLSLAAVSHDLRTSLTRLKLMAEQVEQPALRAAIDRELDEMRAMLEATLDYAEGHLRREESRDVDLPALLISLCDTAADQGAAARYDGPDHVVLHCRPLALKRAFGNLLGNALAYGGSAEVSLEVAGDVLQVRVRDRGPGIAAADLEAAFQPFRRLEPSRSRGTGGIGLGLTIARDLVHAHGGTITLANRDPGLEVTVRLPVTGG